MFIVKMTNHLKRAQMFVGTEIICDTAEEASLFAFPTKEAATDAMLRFPEICPPGTQNIESYKGEVIEAEKAPKGFADDDPDRPQGKCVPTAFGPSPSYSSSPLANQVKEQLENPPAPEDPKPEIRTGDWNERRKPKHPKKP
jgi:hypothetical protein